MVPNSELFGQGIDPTTKKSESESKSFVVNKLVVKFCHFYGYFSKGILHKIFHFRPMDVVFLNCLEPFSRKLTPGPKLCTSFENCAFCLSESCSFLHFQLTRICAKKHSLWYCKVLLKTKWILPNFFIYSSSEKSG